MFAIATMYEIQGMKHDALPIRRARLLCVAQALCNMPFFGLVQMNDAQRIIFAKEICI